MNTPGWGSILNCIEELKKLPLVWQFENAEGRCDGINHIHIVDGKKVEKYGECTCLKKDIEKRKEMG